MNKNNTRIHTVQDAPGYEDYSINTKINSVYQSSVLNNGINTANSRIINTNFINFANKIPETVYAYDIKKSENIFCSESIKKLLGYSPAEIKQMSGNFLTSLVHPEDLLLYSHSAKAYETAGDNDVIETEFRAKAKDGSWKWIKSKESILGRDDDNNPSVILGIAEDISSLKDEINRSKNAEEKFRTLIQYSTDMISVLDAKGTILFVSPSIKNILGYTPAERIGKNSFEFVHKEDRERVIKAFKLGFITPGKPITVEYRFLKADGSYIYIESTGTNFTHLSYVNGIVVNSRNISKRKKVEKDNAKLTAAIQQSSNTVVITDTNGKIEYVNKKFEDLTGYSKEEAIGKYPSILKSGETTKETYKDIWTTILTGKTWEGELKNRKKSGEFYWESVKITPIVDDTDKVINFIAVKDDITEKKLQDEKLLKSLEEKELMLREIHHRVKNNLQIVNSLLSLQASSVDEPQLKAQLVISQNRVKSMSLIHQLLYKSKDLSSINMEEYLYGLLSYMLASYGELQDRINIKIDCKDIFFTLETAVPFGLLLNELITNSLKHGFPKGRKGSIDIIVKKNENNEFTLNFNDNGIGIPLTVVNGHVMTFGMYLIDTLVNQIDGKLEMKTDCGTSYIINFRGNNYQTRFHIS